MQEKKWIIAYFDASGEVVGPIWEVESKIRPTQQANKAFAGSGLTYKIKEVAEFSETGYKDSFIKSIDKPPFRRYQTVTGVSYEVLNSKKTAYYTVELLNGKAVICECKHREFKPYCGHGDIAEREEFAYQSSLARETVQGTLNNSNKGFRVLR